jgi:hypothetical protein
VVASRIMPRIRHPGGRSLGTNILIAARHRPVVLAKVTLTLDVLSVGLASVVDAFGFSVGRAREQTHDAGWAITGVRHRH